MTKNLCILETSIYELRKRRENKMETFEIVTNLMANARALKLLDVNCEYQNQEEYNKREQEYLELKEQLHDEQVKVIENYFSAQEDLWMEMFDKIYQQGMVDCVDILKSLKIL